MTTAVMEEQHQKNDSLDEEAAEVAMNAEWKLRRSTGNCFEMGMTKLNFLDGPASLTVAY
jgi:hypothetical protein